MTQLRRSNRGTSGAARPPSRPGLLLPFTRYGAAAAVVPAASAGAVLNVDSGVFQLGVVKPGVYAADAGSSSGADRELKLGAAPDVAVVMLGVGCASMLRSSSSSFSTLEAILSLCFHLAAVLGCPTPP